MRGRDIVSSTWYKIPHIESENSKSIFLKAKTTLQSTVNNLKVSIPSHTQEDLLDIIVVLAVNQQLQPWNNADLICCCQELLPQLLAQHDLEANMPHKLFEKYPKLCLEMNVLISSTLRRDQWQDHAIMCSFYTWYCKELSFPLVSEYLDILLPPSLHLVDSYIDEMKVIGVECLSHIMKESGKAELRWHGRSGVILDALLKLTYSKHEPLLVILHPTLIQILEVLDTDSNSVRSSPGENIYRSLLSDMYLEDNLALRRSYAYSMKLYIMYMKGNIVKHLKETMRIVLNYLEDSCGSSELTRLTMLEILSLLFEAAQPRIVKYYKETVKILLRLVVDTAVLPLESDTRNTILLKIASLLKHVHKNTNNFVLPTLEALTGALPEFPNHVEEGNVLASAIIFLKSEIK